MNEPRYFAVSSGNGNDGVSQMFPDYVVKTNEPWLLAKLAALTDFKPGKGRQWCRANLQVDGEEDYTIQATLFDPPGRDGTGWCDANGAWRIWEVFPYDEPSDDFMARHGKRPTYESLEECFGKREVGIDRRKEIIESNANA